MTGEIIIQVHNCQIILLSKIAGKFIQIITLYDPVGIGYRKPRSTCCAGSVRAAVSYDRSGAADDLKAARLSCIGDVCN